MIRNKSPVAPKILTDVPKASEEAIDFLDNITLEMLNSLPGKDELIYYAASEADHNEIGLYLFQLQITSKNLKPVIKITVSFKYTINDIVRTTDVISNLTLQAKLTEQHYEQHIKAKYHLMREMNVVLQDDGLVVTLNYFIDGRANMQSIYMIPNHALGGFVPSAFNVLLLKLLARVGGVPKNQMNFIGMDSYYNICPVFYTNLPRTKLNVNDTWVDAVTIERKILGKHGDEIKRYFLDESGNLLMVMKFEEELYGIAPGVKHTKPILRSFFEDHKIRKKFDWEKDLEMMSKFQYLKEKNKGELLKYCYKNPYWKSIIADFLQQLLIDKPTDALSYTANYFNNFASSISEGSQKSFDRSKKGS